ncbi:uncharacterized protein LOC124281318 isoform X1 [Haliotis rubra]|uniref:uncharacterized protein LOC124254506 isoform X1 n=1 Tax=Haliotis rubra TaxID=36100 RepID=UPI001EE62BFC|nr:uncharacterized protein LOC124254506 isoform X1 [Haliotis rubra]XP_046573300.1 uncharacterized protein LOC124281318 isoform X1 [Haliotis rubra]
MRRNSIKCVVNAATIAVKAVGIGSTIQPLLEPKASAAENFRSSPIISAFRRTTPTLPVVTASEKWLPTEEKRKGYTYQTIMFVLGNTQSPSVLGSGGRMGEMSDSCDLPTVAETPSTEIIHGV